MEACRAQDRPAAQVLREFMRDYIAKSGAQDKHPAKSIKKYAFRNAGAELAVTYLNDKARPYVEPVAKALEAPLKNGI